jgi:hypothetical protein
VLGNIQAPNSLLKVKYLYAKNLEAKYFYETNDIESHIYIEENCKLEKLTDDYLLEAPELLFEVHGNFNCDKFNFNGTLSMPVASKKCSISYFSGIGTTFLGNADIEINDTRTDSIYINEINCKNFTSQSSISAVKVQCTNFTCYGNKIEIKEKAEISGKYETPNVILL